MKYFSSDQTDNYANKIKLHRFCVNSKKYPCVKKLYEYEASSNKGDRPANSRERWAGALMEARSLFGLNSAV